MTAMRLLHSLRAQHYARRCETHGHLCALIAAHARAQVGPAAWKRTGAGQSVAPEAEVPGTQDAIAANYATTRSHRRTVRTREPNEG